jgi:mannose-1-phosphate guanylyltransferase
LPGLNRGAARGPATPVPARAPRARSLSAMILAAGRGTRLGALGRGTPKVLLEVAGEPLLARQVRYLAAGGAGRIVVNAHHLAEQIEQCVAARRWGAEVQVIRERKLLGTAGGVRNALARLGRGPFVVLYGDVLIDEPLHAVLATHRLSGAQATITIYQSEHTEGKGTVTLTADRCVAAFEEKTGRTAGHAYINAGLYVVDPSLVAELPLGAPLDFGHDVFPGALARGRRIATHLIAAPVTDIGTPAALALARAAAG